MSPTSLATQSTELFSVFFFFPSLAPLARSRLYCSPHTSALGQESSDWSTCTGHYPTKLQGAISTFSVRSAPRPASAPRRSFQSAQSDALPCGSDGPSEASGGGAGKEGDSAAGSSCVKMEVGLWEPEELAGVVGRPRSRAGEAVGGRGERTAFGGVLSEWWGSESVVAPSSVPASPDLSPRLFFWFSVSRRK